MRSSAFRIMILAALASTLLGTARPAFASDCVVPICSEGFRWEGGECNSGPAPGTIARAHERVDCPSGWIMATERGECLNPACPPEALCRTLSACASDMTFVPPNAEFPDGTCGSEGFTYRSHSPLRCPAGFNVDRSRGICIEANCPPPQIVGRSIRSPTAPEVVRPIVAAPIGVPVATALPDLQVDSLRLVGWERTCPSDKPVGTLEAMVRNVGAAATTTPVPIEAIDVHAAYWRATGVIPALAARSGPVRVTLRLPYAATDPAHMRLPAHQFVAKADPAGVLRELSVANNKSPLLEVGPPPCVLAGK